MSKRRQNFQNVSWFLDLFNRELLDMSPPYQRRSVWNQTYREQFIDTILMDYPAPALFLFGRIDEKGVTTYELVDGKQRLTTIFEFVQDAFEVSDESPATAFRGKTFTSLPPEVKIAFWEYDFSVEYLPTNNEEVINSIFDRLNRNTSKLTAQELRHARFNGRFITLAESLADWMVARFGQKPFPRIADASRRQMKDVEIVATLLLFLEEGPRGYSSLGFDEAFSERDKEWEKETEIFEEFQAVVNRIARLAQNDDGQFLSTSRFRNQADFYSLFGAIAELQRECSLPDDDELVCNRLKEFLTILEDENRASSRAATAYYDAARSASNDGLPRSTRIQVMKKVISGSPLE